jgi:2-iminobutanoate/2-iminopropanoate deaminase
MQRKTPVHPAGAPTPAGPYTPAIIAGGFLFTSGQVPKDPATNQVVQGDITVQTRQVMENLKTLLTAAGCTFADVVKATVHLTDLKNFAAFNAVYAEYLTEPYPVRTTVQSILNPGYQVEIDMIAIAPTGGDR